MSGMDLFEDGFPHSTREGYEKGCRGHACPGRLDHGFSCADANVRFHGDFAYQRMVAEGMSPAEIAEAERPAVPVKLSRRERKNARLLTEPTVTMKDSVERVEKPTLVFDTSVPVAGSMAARLALPERRVPARKASGDRTAIVHGTTAGYARGCKTEEGCPGDESGLTCREAYRSYQREYAARRAANGGEKLGPRAAREPAEPRARKLARVPVRMRVLCRFSSEPGPKAISYLVLRNGSWVQGRQHASWAEAVEYARSVVAEYREKAL